MKKIVADVEQTISKIEGNLSNLSAYGVSNSKKAIFFAFADGIQNNIIKLIPDANSQDLNAVRQYIVSNGVKVIGLREEIKAPLKALLDVTPDPRLE